MVTASESLISEDALRCSSNHFIDDESIYSSPDIVLVRSDSKSLSNATLIQVCGAMWRHHRVCQLKLLQAETWHTTYVTTPSKVIILHMMTSSNGNIFRVTGPLWGESTGGGFTSQSQWRGALCFLWSASEQMAGQTTEMPVIWDVIALITTSL